MNVTHLIHECFTNKVVIFFLHNMEGQKLLVASYSHLCGCFWLFALEFWEFVGPTNRLLLENECSLSGVDDHRWWGHSNPTSGQIFCDLHALSGSGDTKTFQFSPVLVPHTSHLVNFYYLIFGVIGAFARYYKHNCPY